MDGDLSKAVLDSFCDNKSREFLQLPRLISKFRGIEHAENVKHMQCQYRKLNKHVARESFLCGSVLESSPH